MIERKMDDGIPYYSVRHNRPETTDGDVWTWSGEAGGIGRCHRDPGVRQRHPRRLWQRRRRRHPRAVRQRGRQRDPLHRTLAFCRQHGRREGRRQRVEVDLKTLRVLVALWRNTRHDIESLRCNPWWTTNWTHHYTKVCRTSKVKQR